MNLEEFSLAFLERDMTMLAPVEFYDFGTILSQVIYRDDPWQVEFVILRPGLGFPRQHRHPDVDTYDFGLGGEQPPFFVNGNIATSLRAGIRPLYRVASSDWHGIGEVPARGACFLSLQQWRNGVTPSAVGLNWEGTPMSLKHKTILQGARAKWIKGNNADIQL